MNFLSSHRPSLIIHVPRLVGPLKELTRQTMQTFNWSLSRAHWESAAGKSQAGVGLGGDKTESERSPVSLCHHLQSEPLSSLPIRLLAGGQGQRWNLRPWMIYSMFKITLKQMSVDNSSGEIHFLRRCFQTVSNSVLQHTLNLPISLRAIQVYIHIFFGLYLHTSAQQHACWDKWERFSISL